MWIRLRVGVIWRLQPWLLLSVALQGLDALYHDLDHACTALLDKEN